MRWPISRRRSGSNVRRGGRSVTHVRHPRCWPRGRPHPMPLAAPARKRVAAARGPCRRDHPKRVRPSGRTSDSVSQRGHCGRDEEGPWRRPRAGPRRDRRRWRAIGRAAPGCSSAPSAAYAQLFAVQPRALCTCARERPAGTVLFAGQPGVSLGSSRGRAPTRSWRGVRRGPSGSSRRFGESGRASARTSGHRAVTGVDSAVRLAVTRGRGSDSTTGS